MMEKIVTGKKGLLGSANLIIGFVVLAIVAAVGALVIQNVQNTLTAGTAAANVTRDTLTGFNNFASLLPVVGIVLAAALILGLIFLAFTRGRAGGE